MKMNFDEMLQYIRDINNHSINSYGEDENAYLAVYYGDMTELGFPWTECYALIRDLGGIDVAFTEDLDDFNGASSTYCFTDEEFRAAFGDVTFNSCNI